MLQAFLLSLSELRTPLNENLQNCLRGVSTIAVSCLGIAKGRGRRAPASELGGRHARRRALAGGPSSRADRLLVLLGSTTRLSRPRLLGGA